MFQLAPKTKRLLELFADADYGASFTYGEILQHTECDVMETDRQRIYSVVRVLEREHNKTLTNIRGQGYTVTPPNQFVGEVQGRARRAGKQLRLAQRTGKAAPLERLTNFERSHLIDQIAFVSRVDQMFTEDRRRLARIEKHLGIEDDGEVVNGSAEEEAA